MEYKLVQTLVLVLKIGGERILMVSADDHSMAATADNDVYT